MTNLTPKMRLKVKRDTSYLPDTNSGVYFRNNISSFRMEGHKIDQWVEKLLPMFNGQFTLGDLTEGLPDPYRNRVYQIAEVLYRNEFVRDMSQDLPHQLDDHILKMYAPQIEFLESFGDSAACRFQAYRRAKVLAVGSGPFFVSLVSSLIESGLPKINMFITDSIVTNRERVEELVARARKADKEVMVQEVSLQKKEECSWREIIQPFESVLYVSQEGDIDELRLLHTVCREENKLFLPALCIQGVGLAGPIVHPDSTGCWESAWRRMHRTTLSKGKQFSSFSPIAGALLANIISFELFKEITSVDEAKSRNHFYLLDLHTLEGNWHSFLPHPLAEGRMSTEWVSDLDLLPELSLNKDVSSKLLLHLSQLTSKESGIFHIFEEGDLKQLPLAQCRVQAVDILSEGPAELLPDIVCNGLTHEEVRREAGLTGIESYVSRSVDLLVTTLPPYGEETAVPTHEFVGVGAGETVSEGISRGLQSCLEKVLNKQEINRSNLVTQVQLDKVDDDHCRFYLNALTTMKGAPVIGLGREVSGFPVVWVGTNEGWFGNVGLNITMALRKALQQALMNAQNKEDYLFSKSLEVSSVHLEEKEPLILVIPSLDITTQSSILQSAIKNLKQQQKQLLVFDLTLEPFLKEGLAGVFGVLIREEGSS
ncbi:putative thiazole-containing bacteriocin maturation protein [Lederbergia citrea]|uniref:putative thiazole-containing bacteriocin maturation protein n=1 Tax=Lederbergia citrea TaxID=2833581 RepID=UPI001BC8FAE1|nr:putative thiazole-containing bacteriocin maturation protein [Lederbergia citrea]MBS4176534.1 putative thiazole-containing bacteriocin maturation protein [Lederbergia citrea]